MDSNGITKPKLAFIGLGTMGAPMARNLLRAGYELTVHNRTRDKERPLEALGARRAASPREAAEGADVVLTNVSDTPDVEAVVLGEAGAAEGMAPGSVLIDFSTISPSATRRLATALVGRGVTMLDAPVSGGSEGAEKGALSIMVGGEPEVFAQVEPVLEALGKTVTLVGPVGSGQMTKAINQVIIAGVYAAVAEGMALGLASGIDLAAARRALGGGAAGSWVLEHRAENMISGSYPLGFRTRLHLKDLGIALEAGRELGVPIPLAAYVAQLEAGLVGRGYGDEDVSNIARAVREQAGLD